MVFKQQILDSYVLHLSKKSANFTFAKNFVKSNLTSKYDPKKCQPQTSVSFAKTHKTGSSTLQNIFFRYGWNHNLSFVCPQQKTWMFSFKQPFSATLGICDFPLKILFLREMRNSVKLNFKNCWTYYS